MVYYRVESRSTKDPSRFDDYQLISTPFNIGLSSTVARGIPAVPWNRAQIKRGASF